MADINEFLNWYGEMAWRDNIGSGMSGTCIMTYHDHDHGPSGLALSSSWDEDDWSNIGQVGGRFSERDFDEIVQEYGGERIKVPFSKRSTCYPGRAARLPISRAKAFIKDAGNAGRANWEISPGGIQDYY